MVLTNYTISQDDVRDWLIKLGLESYWEKFSSNSYTEPNSLADLKFMDRQTIMQTFQIVKEGHLKKLSNAICYLAYPSSGKHLRYYFLCGML